jgi:hypothetical protein
MDRYKQKLNFLYFFVKFGFPVWNVIEIRLVVSEMKRAD